MSNQKPKPVETVDKAVNKYHLILGVRRIKDGAFKGLWELTELSGDCSVKKVISDANTKASIINLAARAIGATL